MNRGVLHQELLVQFLPQPLAVRQAQSRYQLLEVKWPPSRLFAVSNLQSFFVFWLQKDFFSPYYLNWRPQPQPALLGEMLFWASWFEGGRGCTFLQIACDPTLCVLPADKAPAAKHHGTIGFLSAHACQKGFVPWWVSERHRVSPRTASAVSVVANAIPLWLSWDNVLEIQVFVKGFQ